MEAAYAVVLFNDYMKTETEIAELLGLTKNTVSQILRADPAIVKEKPEGTIREGVKTHIAGALAKIADREIKAGRNNVDLFTRFSPKTLEYTRTIEVLIRVKGVNFPAGRDGLIEKLSDLTVEGRSLKNLLEEMDASLFPMKNPSELLHWIKQQLKNGYNYPQLPDTPARKRHCPAFLGGQAGDRKRFESFHQPKKFSTNRFHMPYIAP